MPLVILGERVNALLTFIAISGITLGSALLERKFQKEGNLKDADTVKWFGRSFMIGSGGYVLYCWAVAAAALISL